MKRIVYLQHTNPAAYPPLEHGSQILAAAGWKVLFLGAVDRGSDKLDFPVHANIEVRLLPLGRPGLARKVRYIQFCFWAVVRAAAFRPGWIYVSGLFACPPAALLAFFFGTPLVYHEHDLADETGSGSAVYRLALSAQRWVARRSRMNVLPNADRLQVFDRRVGGLGEARLACVWNCPRAEEARAPRTAAPGERLKIYYHGNISPRLVPESLLEAIRPFRGKVELHVVGYETAGNEGYADRLKAEWTAAGMGDSIHFYEARPRRELWKLMDRCDVGLALMPKDSENPNLRMMAGASNKAFDYLAAGMPLLVSDLEDWKDMYVAPGYGLACDPASPASIAAAIRWYLDHPAEVLRMGNAGRERVLHDWNYQRRFAPVLELLNGGAS